MCQCTSEIRTPYCGRGDCVPPPLTPQEIRGQATDKRTDTRKWYEGAKADLEKIFLRTLEDIDDWEEEQLARLEPAQKTEADGG